MPIKKSPKAKAPKIYKGSILVLTKKAQSLLRRESKKRKKDPRYNRWGVTMSAVASQAIVGYFQ